MTQSVYIIGAAGTGKSTFTAELMKLMGVELGPLEDLHSKPNAAGNKVTMRGHAMVNRNLLGLYLGVMRDQFPGSDGLDRASSLPGEEWLHTLGYTGGLPDCILAEGATLATRRFMNALHDTTNLLVLALRCDPVIHDLRLAERGAEQVSSFVLSTVTKTENLVKDMRKAGARCEWIDADVPKYWEDALQLAESHLNQ